MTREFLCKTHEIPFEMDLLLKHRFFFVCVSEHIYTYSTLQHSWVELILLFCYIDTELLLTCIGRLLAMVKLGMGGRALYVLVSAVSGLPSMEPDEKDTAGAEERTGQEEEEIEKTSAFRQTAGLFLEPKSSLLAPVIVR